MTAFLLTAAPAAGEAPGALASIVSFLPIILIFVVFYFMLIRPQKKREKAVQEMRSRIEVGDEIVTVGGIIGRVVNLKDDTLVLETGTDRSKLRIARWAIQTNNTIHDDKPAD